MIATTLVKLIRSLALMIVLGSTSLRILKLISKINETSRTGFQDILKRRRSGLFLGKHDAQSARAPVAILPTRQTCSWRR